MPDFQIKIAGKVAAVRAMFETTPLYCKAYLSQEPPEFTITVTEEDLAFEQADAIEEAHREGFRVRYFTPPFLERAAIQRKFAEYLLGYDTLLLHGSAIGLDGQGYLFTAKSGTGKSTHTRLWRETFGDRAVMINDDKPFVHISRDGVTMYGSPWSGKHGLDTNVAVPLKGICLLERGVENRVSRLQPSQGDFLSEPYCCPLDPARFPAIPGLLARLAQTVPLWHMTCTKDPQAAQISYNALSQNHGNRLPAR